MVAGLFSRHGVFFGDCIQANQYNPKGYFESAYMKRVFRGEESLDDWPRSWFRNLFDEGLCGCGQPWGIKCGPQRDGLILQLQPTVIVFTHRPVEQVRASRERVHWARGDADALVKSAERSMDRIRERSGVPCVDVDTDALVDGEYHEIVTAFELLGRKFNPGVASNWIDPELWSRS